MSQQLASCNRVDNTHPANLFMNRDQLLSVTQVQDLYMAEWGLQRASIS